VKEVSGYRERTDRGSVLLRGCYPNLCHQPKLIFSGKGRTRTDRRLQRLRV